MNKPPATHNLPAHTRDAAVAAGRRAARHGDAITECPWVKDWGMKNGPISQDDPRPAEIFTLWNWAHDDERKKP